MNSFQVKYARARNDQLARVDRIASLLGRVQKILGSETNVQYLKHMYSIYMNTSGTQLATQCSELENFVLSYPTTIAAHNEIVQFYNTMPECKDRFTLVTLQPLPGNAISGTVGVEDEMQDIQPSNASRTENRAPVGMPGQVIRQARETGIQQLPFRLSSPRSPLASNESAEEWFNSLNLKDPKNVFAIAEKFGFLEDTNAESRRIGRS